MSVALTGLSLAAAMMAADPAMPASASGEPEAPMTASAPAGTVLREARLPWAEPVNLSVEESPYEVVIRFDRPLAEDSIQQFAAATKAVLADLRWNDDTLVMRPAVGSRIVAIKDNNGLLVRFVAEDGASLATPAVEDDGDIELVLARASADIAAGYPGAARQRLRELARAHPGNRQIERAMADADAAEGRTSDAAVRYAALDADDPLARRIIGEAGGRAAAATIYRDGKTFSQWETSLEGSISVSPGLVAGIGARHVRTIAEGVSGSAGYLSRIRRNLTFVDAIATFRPSAPVVLTVQASALAEESVAGVGARVVIGPAERQVRVFAAYRLPDYSTAEQAAFGGHISRVGVGGTVRLTPEVAVQGDVSRNGYGLAGGGVRTRTTQLLGGADVLVLRRPFSVQLTYRLDAEYVDTMRRRVNGLPFIPLSDRENHTVQVVMSKPVRHVQMTVAAGWTKDRYGGHGPTASLGAVAYLGDSWRLDASGGVSSVSRPAISGRQVFLRLSISRSLGRP